MKVLFSGGLSLIVQQRWTLYHGARWTLIFLGYFVFAINCWLIASHWRKHWNGKNGTQEKTADIYNKVFQVIFECAHHYSPPPRCSWTNVVFKHHKELSNSIKIEMCWKSCRRTDKLLWCKFNIWKLMKNVLQTIKIFVDILNWHGKLCMSLLVGHWWGTSINPISCHGLDHVLFC